MPRRYVVGGPLRSTTQPLQCRERSATNKSGISLFLLLAIITSICAYIAVDNGDFARAVHGTDSFGNVCGRDNRDEPRVLFNPNIQLDMRDRPYVHYLTPPGLGLRPLSLCVKSCPAGPDDVAATGACLNSDVGGNYHFS